MRYRLVTPHGIYAPGTILDTELPPQRPFSIEEPAARRLSELGVMEPVDDPVLPREEPGWSQNSARPARLDAAHAAASPAGGDAPKTSRRRQV